MSRRDARARRESKHAPPPAATQETPQPAASTDTPDNTTPAENGANDESALTMNTNPTTEAAEVAACGNVICEMEGACVCGAAEAAAAAIEKAKALPAHVGSARPTYCAFYVLAKKGKPLPVVRKQITLDEEGKRVNIRVKGFENGRADRQEKSLREIAERLKGEPPPQFGFLTAGVHRATDSVMMMGSTSKARNSRSAENFPFPDGPALLCLDTDEIGHWPGFREPGDVLAALRQCELNSDAITSSSASSYLRAPAWETGLRGLHTLTVIDRGTEIPRVLDAMHARAWLLGYGRILVSDSGTLLERSIVDRALRTPNQPIFEFGAILLNDRITQQRRVELHEGAERMLRADSIADLTPSERAEYERLVAAAKAELRGAAETKTAAWLERNLAKVPEAEREAARAHLLKIRDSQYRDLPDSFMVPLNDGGFVSVADIKADPDRWHNTSVPDPLEPEYGQSKATIFTKPREGHPNDRPVILSMAHGQNAVYFLEQRRSEWGDAFVSDEERRAGMDRWRTTIATTDDILTLENVVLDQIQADDVLSSGQRRDLAHILHERFTRLSSSGKAPFTPAQLQKRIARNARREERPDDNWMLDELAVVRMGGKVAVLFVSETESPDNEQPVVTMKVADTRQFYAAETVMRFDPEKDKLVPQSMFDEWLSHRATTRFLGIEFEPNPARARRDFYNLWKGLRLKPQQGDCSRFLAHIRDVICAGDEAHFDWLIKWLADMVQNPGRKPGTAVVLRGGEGAGKGAAFADQLRDIIGVRLYRKVSRGDQLIGKHNAHLAGALMIFANESVWGGDKSKEGALKDLITESRQMIEPKGIDAFEVADYARILFATNEGWAVPAGHDARRYFVLDVSNGKQGDAAYFRALYREMDDGGREAFLHHLMHVDLTRFNVHQAPKTAALLDLKLRRLSTEDRWLLDLLHIRGTADGGDVWPARWRCSDMFDAYAIYARNAGDRHPMASSQFGEWLHKRVPGVSVGRRGSEPRHYKLPPLDECRTGFEQFIGHEIGWDSDDITDDESDWD